MVVREYWPEYSGREYSALFRGYSAIFRHTKRTGQYSRIFGHIRVKIENSEYCGQYRGIRVRRCQNYQYSPEYSDWATYSAKKSYSHRTFTRNSGARSSQSAPNPRSVSCTSVVRGSTPWRLLRGGGGGGKRAQRGGRHGLEGEQPHVSTARPRDKPPSQTGAYQTEQPQHAASAQQTQTAPQLSEGLNRRRQRRRIGAASSAGRRTSPASQTPTNTGTKTLIDFVQEVLWECYP